jgi:hypothetical protein
MYIKDIDFPSLQIAADVFKLSDRWQQRFIILITKWRPVVIGGKVN